MFAANSQDHDRPRLRRAKYCVCKMVVRVDVEPLWLLRNRLRSLLSTKTYGAKLHKNTCSLGGGSEDCDRSKQQPGHKACSYPALSSLVDKPQKTHKLPSISATTTTFRKQSRGVVAYCHSCSGPYVAPSDCESESRGRPALLSTSCEPIPIKACWRAFKSTARERDKTNQTNRTDKR